MVLYCCTIWTTSKNSGNSSNPIVCHKFMYERQVCLYFNLHFSSVLLFALSLLDDLCVPSLKYTELTTANVQNTWLWIRKDSPFPLLKDIPWILWINITSSHCPNIIKEKRSLIKFKRVPTKREKPSQFLYYLSWSALLPQFSSNHQRYVCNPLEVVFDWMSSCRCARQAVPEEM